MERARAVFRICTTTLRGCYHSASQYGRIFADGAATNPLRNLEGIVEAIIVRICKVRQIQVDVAVDRKAAEVQEESAAVRVSGILWG